MGRLGALSAAALRQPRRLASHWMEVEEAIRTRRTHKAYRPEPVDREQLEEILDLARWAPNHNHTNPWRFRVIGAGALERLKDAAGPESSAKLDRAPTLVVVSCALSGDEIQDEEDLHAAACAAYIVLLAAHGRGLATYWRTATNDERAPPLRKPATAFLDNPSVRLRQPVYIRTAIRSGAAAASKRKSAAWARWPKCVSSRMLSRTARWPSSAS